MSPTQDLYHQPSLFRCCTFDDIVKHKLNTAWNSSVCCSIISKCTLLIMLQACFYELIKTTVITCVIQEHFGNSAHYLFFVSFHTTVIWVSSSDVFNIHCQPLPSIKVVEHQKLNIWSHIWMLRSKLTIYIWVCISVFKTLKSIV